MRAAVADLRSHEARFLATGAHIPAALKHKVVVEREEHIPGRSTAWQRSARRAATANRRRASREEFASPSRERPLCPRACISVFARTWQPAALARLLVMNKNQFYLCFRVLRTRPPAAPLLGRRDQRPRRACVCNYLTRVQLGASVFPHQDLTGF